MTDANKDTATITLSIAASSSESLARTILSLSNFLKAPALSENCPPTSSEVKAEPKPRATARAKATPNPTPQEDPSTADVSGGDEIDQSKPDPEETPEAEPETPVATDPNELDKQFDAAMILLSAVYSRGAEGVAAVNGLKKRFGVKRLFNELKTRPVEDKQAFIDAVAQTDKEVAQ